MSRRNDVTGDTPALPRFFTSFGAFMTGNVSVSALIERRSGPTGPYLGVVQYKFTGVANDLIDFDFDADPDDWSIMGIGEPSKHGAIIQAGFGTLGTAGEVFKVDFDFTNSPSQVGDIDILLSGAP